MTSYLSSRHSDCCELLDQPRLEVSYVTVMLAPRLRCVEAERVVVPDLPQHVNEGKRMRLIQGQSASFWQARSQATTYDGWVGLDVRPKSDRGTGLVVLDTREGVGVGIRISRRWYR